MIGLHDQLTWHDHWIIFTQRIQPIVMARAITCSLYSFIYLFLNLLFYFVFFFFYSSFFQYTYLLQISFDLLVNHSHITSSLKLEYKIIITRQVINHNFIFFKYKFIHVQAINKENNILKNLFLTSLQLKQCKLVFNIYSKNKMYENFNY